MDIFGSLSELGIEIHESEVPVSLCQYLVDNNYYELHVCFASFVAEDIGDLSLTKGDIIVAVHRANEHWMQGQVCFDGQANLWQKLVPGQQIGNFPLNHCWQLDSDKLKLFCQEKIKSHLQQPTQLAPSVDQDSSSRNCPRPLGVSHPIANRLPLLTATHSSSLSSASSSNHSNEFHVDRTDSGLSQSNFSQMKPPPRPEQLPRQIVQRQANFELHQANQQVQQSQPSKATSLLTLKQQDKLKGWIHTVRKKTARLSTRITASLGLISLTRDEEFERHYERFKHIEKTIRVFIKNLTGFVEHFENFLLALQNTSENLSDFYRDKSHQKELEELKRKNKALACEHFHAFKRTVERQVVAVANQLLQKFAGPYQLISKRSAKLLDYDTRTKEMESCRDLQKKNALRDQYVIAKDLYDKINKQLIEELPVFNQLALDIFRDCILVLLDSRRNLILSYTKQTASLLETPLMMTYTASHVANNILMSCDSKISRDSPIRHTNNINEIIEQERKDSGQTSGHDTRQSSGNDDYISSRPQSAASQLSSEFDQLVVAARDKSSTPLSRISTSDLHQPVERIGDTSLKFSDEPDGGRTSTPVPGAKGTTASGNNHSKAPALPKPASVGHTPLKEQGHDSSVKERRRKKKFQIYVAEWPFLSTGPNQLTITCKQPLKLIKSCDECGNNDWSLVQDKKGQLGYVPSSYIKKKE